MLDIAENFPLIKSLVSQQVALHNFSPNIKFASFQNAFLTLSNFTVTELDGTIKCY